MPAPSVPPTLAGDVAQWARDLKQYLDRALGPSAQSGLTTLKHANFVALEANGKLGRFKGAATVLLIPDHPLGASLAVWDGSAWARFTQTGTV